MLPPILQHSILLSLIPRHHHPKLIALRNSNSNRAPEESELTDVLELMAHPPAVTIDMIAVAAGTKGENIDFAEWLRDRKNNRILPHRLEKCGYVAIRNETECSGRWKIHGKRQTVYARFELSNEQAV